MISIVRGVPEKFYFQKSIIIVEEKMYMKTITVYNVFITVYIIL